MSAPVKTVRTLPVPVALLLCVLSAVAGMAMPFLLGPAAYVVVELVLLLVGFGALKWARDGGAR